jgi:hypothetical protein
MAPSTREPAAMAGKTAKKPDNGYTAAFVPNAKKTDGIQQRSEQTKVPDPRHLECRTVLADASVRVLTPPSTVAAIHAGYIPQVHASAAS